MKRREPFAKPILRDVSLSRALSKLGFCSRSEADAVIHAGRVTVNRRVVHRPSHRCSLFHDAIAVDGNLLAEKRFTYIMMNKPAGVITTRSDERGRKTVYDLLPDMEEWLFPVGRLDKDSTGLLILTSDHQWAERTTSPSFHVPKTYFVLLDKPLRESHKQTLKSGMTIGEERFMPVEVRSAPGENLKVELILKEGKNRQIRRMMEALGYSIVSLHRTKIGSLSLGALRPGEWKYLSRADILSTGSKE